MQSNADSSPLARAAGRAERDPFFVASALAGYRELAGMTNAELAAWLGGRSGTITRLALCRRPDEDSAMYGDDVKRIASYAGVDAGRLATLLRAAANLEAMRAGSPASLLAARDRGQDEGPNPATGDVAGRPEEIP
jgi:hypothetical protein